MLGEKKREGEQKIVGERHTPQESSKFGFKTTNKKKARDSMKIKAPMMVWCEDHELRTKEKERININERVETNSRS